MYRSLTILPESYVYGALCREFQIRRLRTASFLRKDRSSYIRANATIELQSVNPFFDRYVGNHDIWKMILEAIKTIKTDGRYV